MFDVINKMLLVAVGFGLLFFNAIHDVDSVIFSVLINGSALLNIALGVYLLSPKRR